MKKLNLSFIPNNFTNIENLINLETLNLYSNSGDELFFKFNSKSINLKKIVKLKILNISNTNIEYLDLRNQKELEELYLPSQRLGS